MSDLTLQRYEELLREQRRCELDLLTVQIEMEKFMRAYRASLRARQVQQLAVTRIPDRSVISLVREYVEPLPAATYFTNDELRRWCEVKYPEDFARFKRGLYLALGKLIFENQIERAGADGFRVLKLQPSP